MLAVADIYITEQLDIRPASRTDYLREKLALQELAREMAERPSEVLPRLVAIAMEICEADSAGISLYEPGQGGPGVFRWHHLRGVLQRFNGATTPRDFSPCGICLDQHRPTLATHPERVYSWIADADIVIPEVLLVPLYSGATEVLGTLWVIAQPGRQFDQGHSRVMMELGAFAGLAFRMVEHERHLTLALGRAQAMADEMSHRVKNLFAIANGLVAVSARNVSTPAEMAANLSGRFSALARAHAIVRKSFGDPNADDLTGSLNDLVVAILDPYDAREGKLVQGPPAMLTERAISAFGLVLHEFATNSAKYGALKDGVGRVAVTWTTSPDGLLLTWQETGGEPISGPPIRNGFGTVIATRSIEQLGGSSVQDWRPDGLRIDITLPRSVLSDDRPG